MNLDYDVLWIDDRPRQIEDVKNHISAKLSRRGFNLNVKMIENPGDGSTLKKHFKSTKYDLLVVDYRLQSESSDGNVLIRKIRRFCHYTDVVFYSSEDAKALRAKIDVDGVYCANRPDLRDTIWHVIESTIKKAGDLNSMRGLSIAQIADFDHSIDQSIMHGFDKVLNSEKKSAFILELCESATKYHAGKVEAISEMAKDQPIQEYTKLLTSNPKHQFLLKLIDLIDDDSLYQSASRISNYSNDVILNRNLLAHSMQLSYEYGSYKLMNGEKNIIFTEDDFTTIRVKLLEYKEEFERILRLVKNR